MCSASVRAPASKTLKQQFTGVSILPVLQLLFAEETSTQWHWFRSSADTTSSTAATLQGASQKGDGEAAGQHDGFEAIPDAAGRLYVPTPEDESHVLRVKCTPGIRWIHSAILLCLQCNAAAVLLTSTSCLFL